jgi:hypothetical protein
VTHAEERAKSIEMSKGFTLFLGVAEMASHEICPKRSRPPLALGFSDTSLFIFIKVVKRLERNIDEKLRSSTSWRAGIG